MRETGTARLMRRLNRSAVLNLVRTASPISRSEIARRLELSLPTVMRMVEDLVEEDLVYFAGTEPSGGRRRPLINFNGAAHTVIGIDLGGSKLYGTVTDLTGRILHEIRVPWHEAGGPDCALDSLYSTVEELLAFAETQPGRIRGIGIGAPGVTLSGTGTVVWAPSLGWRDLPLRELLGERFAPPVFVENDVNVAALGEFGFGIARNTPNLVCIAIGTGIGAGIIIDGKLVRGHNQGAGEIGYFLPTPADLGKQYAGFGALEDVASGRGIALRAHQALSAQGHPLSARRITTEEVFEYARQGESWARQVVDEAVDYLSQALVAIAALLDPEAIVLGGGVAQSADLLIDPIIRRLQGVVPFVPRIVASDLGPRAVVMGTIMLVLDATTGHVMVNQRS